MLVSSFAAVASLTLAAHALASVAVWTYAGQNYPTQAAALAAMHAVSANNALLTQQVGISGMGTATVTYKYGAPTLPLTKGPLYICPSDPQGDCNPSSTTADQAVQYSLPYLSSPYYGYCNPYFSPPTIVSPWTVVPDYGELLEQQTYQVALTTACTTGNGEGGIVTYPVGYAIQFSIFEIQVYSCPNYYGFSGNPTSSCVNPHVDTISSTLLECPENGSPSTSVGDPCDVLTGDFSQTESDYSGSGLRFQRYYHSATLESNHTLGVGWTHNYAAYLVLTNGVPTGLLRPNGHQDALISTSTSGVYISLSGAAIHVQLSGTNWVATLKDGSSEIYNSTGQLIQLITPGGLVTTLTYNSNNQLMSVSSPFGRALQFSYNSSNQLQQLIDPAGKFVTYGYGTNNNLISVTYQDATTRTYAYTNSSFPNNLTGIVDESKNQFLTVQYDPTTGAATSAQQAGGAQAVTISYSPNGAIAKDALGATHTYTFTSDTNYAPRVTALSINSLNQSFTVPAGANDPQRRVTQSVDANGNITTFAYDANHLTSKTEAYGSAVARTTSYQYLSTLSALPTLITEPLRQTSFTYYAGTNNVETKTVTDITATPNIARTWTYTYDSYGRVLTAKGPRTDLNSTTTYAYYTCTTGTQCGQIETITDAVGHITTFNTYNAYGQPLTITDPNGLVTTLTYDARQRVKSREVGTETTGYSYYPTGLLETVTLPDSSTMTYTYDGAHRLTDITDSLGNHAHYTLDAMGNHTADSIYDPSATLRRTHTRVFNALNELYEDVDAADTAAVTTTFGYDNNGNQTNSDAPLLRNTKNAFDALNRLDQMTDPKSRITKVTYDAHDNVTSVIDPRNFTTGYTHDGFDEVTKLVSPDTGISSNTYDSGGNLKTTTDARGAMGTYTYDALNRVTQVAYTDQTIKFTYDAGTNGKGRLTGASDANHSMSWSYDSHGRVTGKGQTVASITKSVGYSYTNADMTSLVTPSGQTITYGYTNHRITSISVNGTTLLSGVIYFPFGPVSAWTWGNSTPVSRTYTTDGQVSQIATAGDVFTFGRDNALRITSIVDTESYVDLSPVGYDVLDRLSSATNSGSAYGWTYDANGNTLALSGPTATTYTLSTSSNRLKSTAGALVRSYSYDAAGNTASYTGVSFTFNQRGRMSSATTSAGATDYIYNALGQLIEKYGAGGTTLLVYDEAGHLLGEYSGTGALIQETVWMDDTPVATLRPNGSTISVYYVHTDHLNAPLAITQPTTHALMWFWAVGGTGSPNQNPQNQVTFVYNLRYPGQYFQAETGLYYNYFRDYDPQTERYVESDPIGLHGGSYSTYSYAGSNPLSNYDPLGLSCTAAGGAFSCTTPYGQLPPLPEPTGWPQTLNGSTEDYHAYNIGVPLNGANLNCVMNGIIDNPTPGQPSPATPQGTLNNATPTGAQSLFDALDWTSSFGTDPGGYNNSPVYSYVVNVNGNPAVVNVTLPGHPLFPGYVLRTIVGGQVVNYGEGAGALQGSLSQALGIAGQINGVWNGQTTGIIKNCGCQVN